MPNVMNVWIKEARKKLIDQFGGKCIVCGTTNKLEFAHIHSTDLKGYGRGRKERYYDVIKNPEAYTLLCKEHHEAYDHGIISLGQYLREIKNE